MRQGKERERGGRGREKDGERRREGVKEGEGVGKRGR